MTLDLSKATRQLLQLIADRGSISVADLLTADGIEEVLADESTSVRGRVLTLSSAGFVAGNKPHPDRATEYEVTTAGRRYLRSSEVNTGSVATPREPFSAQPYIGHELRPFTARAGAMAAFALPSLHAGQRVDRKAPTPIGSATRLEAAK